MTVAAILTAAGSGSRLGLDVPKALVPVLGLPLLAHAVDALREARSSAGEAVDVLVVTAPDDQVATMAAIVRERWRSGSWLVVPGGPSRQASVAAGLAALSGPAGSAPHDNDQPVSGLHDGGAPTPRGAGVDVVLVHDAARPFAPAGLIGRVLDAVRGGHGAVVPGLPVADTVKRVGPDEGGAEPVLDTPDRSALRAVQTPQGFRRDLLERAHAHGADRAGDEARAASDDAGLVEALGERVWIVPGDELAAKITTARDLALARLLREAP